MAARYVTASELGRLVGVSRQAVADAKRKEIISPNREGLFDIMDPEIEQWIHQRPIQRTTAARKKAREASSPSAPEVLERVANNPPKTTGARALAAAQDGAEIEEIEKPNVRYRGERGSSGGDPSYASSERKLKAAQAEVWQCRAQERRGELLPKVLVEAFLNKLYAIDQSQWLCRGDRIAAQIVAIVHSASDDGSAELEVNRALTEDAYSEQRSKKRELENFLESIKSKLDDEPNEGGDHDES